MVRHWTARMPPHISTVLRYHSGKWPSVQASEKLLKANGPAGRSEARSIAPAWLGRRLATAIQANGIAHSSAAAHSSSRTSGRASGFIVDASLQGAQRDDRQGEQDGDADYGGGRGEADVVVLRGLLVDVIQQQHC